VGLSHFFRDPTRHTISITRKAHFEAQERGMEHARITPLNAMEESAPRSDSAAEPVGGGPKLVAQMIEFPAGGAASSSNSLHDSSCLVYVLEGQLQLDSGGLHELLKAGDCAYVESDMALSWSAANKRRCRVLAVFAGAA